MDSYEWITPNKNACERCKALHGQVRTLEAWWITGAPALHARCRCYLKPVERMPNPTPGQAAAPQPRGRGEREGRGGFLRQSITGTVSSSTAALNPETGVNYPTDPVRRV